jgi:hypothetical protein
MLTFDAGAPASGNADRPPALFDSPAAQTPNAKGKEGPGRLIRIGPEALVWKDANGHVTMVDEQAKPPSVAKDLTSLGGVFGVLGAGLFLLLEDQGADYTFTHAGAGGVR